MQPFRVFVPFLMAFAIASFPPESNGAAAPAQVGHAFGNTIQSTYPDGRQAELWLAADGSYRAQGRRGDDSSGTWRVRGERMCLRQRRPFAAPISFCTPIPARMDRAWTARAVTGEHVRIRLVRGHVTGHKGQPR